MRLIEAEKFSDVLFSLLIIAGGVFFYYLFEPVFAKDIITRLNLFYETNNITNLDNINYNKLLKYNISLTMFDKEICRLLVAQVNVPYFDRLSDKAKDLAAIHLCSQIIYYNIESMVEEDPVIKEALSKVENKDDIISECLIEYLINNKVDLVNLDFSQFRSCIVLKTLR